VCTPHFGQLHPSIFPPDALLDPPRAQKSREGLPDFKWLDAYVGHDPQNLPQMSMFATDSSTFFIKGSSAGNGAESIIKVSESCSKK
jgi:hypothetical protein